MIMSCEPPKPSPLDSRSQTTEELVKLVDLVAELIRRRNWSELLLLVDAFLILFCTPGGVVSQKLKSWFSLTLPQWYKIVFWLVVALIAIAALCGLVLQKQKPQRY